MTRTTLLALAARVEAATGADRELDAAIAVAVSDDVGAWVVEPSPSSLFSHHPGWFCTSDNRSHKAPAYTASLDAAMSLAKDDERSELLNEAMESVSLNGWKDGEYLQELIRAFVAASLRAIAGSLTDD